MTKFFFKFKKPIFGPLPQFWGQSFSKKIGLSCTTSKGFLASWQNPEKSNDQIPRKDRCQEARMDRSYFTGSFQLLPGGWGGGGGGLTSTTVVD